MLRLNLAASLVACLAACNSSPPEPSRLQQQPPQSEVPPTKATPVGSASPRAPGEPAATEPPPPSERVEIRLALKEGSTYRVTTIGNVRFGSMVQPTGFAREERLTLSDCAGEGYSRACTLEHRYTNFEAEPPSGRFLEADEKEVHQLVTRHKLLATGVRPEATTVRGPKEQAESKAGQALAEAHRFYCLRFPEEAIGVGAKWRSKCHMRTGGVIDSRDVLWELKKLERDPETGLRAELEYVGEYTAPGAKGSMQGLIRGVLYFLVDAGEPHLLREEFTSATDSAAVFVTHTSTAYQFVRLVPGPDGKEMAVRVDGKPLPEAQPLNAPSPADPGAPAGTGAAEPDVTKPAGGPA